MEMPEGYKKLRSIRFENADEADLLVCLNLMKEMAEVLEGFSGKDGYEKVNNVLKKFKEWK